MEISHTGLVKRLDSRLTEGSKNVLLIRIIQRGLV